MSYCDKYIGYTYTHWGHEGIFVDVLGMYPDTMVWVSNTPDPEKFHDGNGLYSPAPNEKDCVYFINYHVLDKSLLINKQEEEELWV